MSDRIYKQLQETILHETLFAQGMLEAGKPKYLKSYLKMTAERAKNGLSADEIDAVTKRAETAVKAAASEAAG